MMAKMMLLTVLDKTINMAREKPPDELVDASVTNQKSGLKVNILNLIKLTSNPLWAIFYQKMKMQVPKKLSISLKF